YADALALDADQFVDEFDARYPQHEEEPPPTVFRPRRPRRLRKRAVVAVVVAAAFVGAAVWSLVAPPTKVTPAQTPAPAVAAPAHPRAAPARSQPQLVRRPALVIRAARGPCWLLVRRGGPNGAVLYEGTLAQGQTRSFAPRVWVRFGAPWQVD